MVGVYPVKIQSQHIQARIDFFSKILLSFPRQHVSFSPHPRNIPTQKAAGNNIQGQFPNSKNSTADDPKIMSLEMLD